MNTTSWLFSNSTVLVHTLRDEEQLPLMLVQHSKIKLAHLTNYLVKTATQKDRNLSHGRLDIEIYDLQNHSVHFSTLTDRIKAGFATIALHDGPFEGMLVQDGVSKQTSLPSFFKRLFNLTLSLEQCSNLIQNFKPFYLGFLISRFNLRDANDAPIKYRFNFPKEAHAFLCGKLLNFRTIPLKELKKLTYSLPIARELLEKNVTAGAILDLLNSHIHPASQSGVAAMRIEFDITHREIVRDAISALHLPALSENIFRLKLKQDALEWIVLYETKAPKVSYKRNEPLTSEGAAQHQALISALNSQLA